MKVSGGPLGGGGGGNPYLELTEEPDLTKGCVGGPGPITGHLAGLQWPGH